MCTRVHTHIPQAALEETHSPSPGRRELRTWECPSGCICLLLSLAPGGFGYLVGKEVLQHQQAVASPCGNGDGDFHQHPMHGEQAQVLDLQPEKGKDQHSTAAAGEQTQRGQGSGDGPSKGPRAELGGCEVAVPEASLPPSLTQLCCGGGG